MIDPFEALMAYHRAENNRASAEDWILLAKSGVRRTVTLETVGVTYEFNCDSRKRIDLQASAGRNPPRPVLSDR
jgi:hypothetical protein